LRARDDHGIARARDRAELHLDGVAEDVALDRRAPRIDGPDFTSVAPRGRRLARAVSRIAEACPIF
jgi:hypothetical protein